jgi:hypothetical protein
VVRSRIEPRIVLVVALAITLASCGGEDGSQGDATPTPQPTAAAPTAPTGPVSNACPPEGCTIDIVDTAASGREISVTWETNFVPDVSQNHIHIFWDIYTADQVSSDAEARGVTQGEWVPTADVPTFVTKGPVSVRNRGTSSVLCVTAGDRDHAVIDASIVDCQDVSDLLP